MAITYKIHKTDRELQTDVLAEVARDWRFKAAEVGVEVDEGVVTLTGTVSTFTKLLAAAEIASRVAGVKDVANKLTVETAGTRDDTKIAKAVRDALLWDTDVPEERIESIVRDGIVTLKGTVSFWYEKHAVTNAVKGLTGVKSVLNDLVVSPAKRTDLEIFEDIKAALKRRMPWAANAIDVTVTGGEVTLMGELFSYSDRRQAEDVAWSATGVIRIKNNIGMTW